MSFFGEVEPVDANTRRAARRSLQKANDLFRAQQYERSIPYFVQALQDYDNVDWIVLKAWRLPDKAMALELLTIVESTSRARLKESLGQDCFEESFYAYGEFWGLFGTRPYMRTLGAIARISYDCGDLDRAIAASSEALRLCHGDNMGQRYMLGTLLIKAGRFADALSFCQVWFDPQYDGCGRPRGGCEFHQPNAEPLTQSTVDWLSKPCTCVLAPAPPLIFTKLLAMRDQPNAPLKKSRPANGPEEAHDYRWLAHDLWTEPDVWAWINGNEDVMDSVTKTCARDGCDRRETRPLQFKECSGCKQVVYCGQGCQRADWPSHKPACTGQEAGTGSTPGLSQVEMAVSAMTIESDEGSESDFMDTLSDDDAPYHFAC
ncbi:hypothetical protein BV20DRAFT_1121480 [Pilatotrama ljubarskyi]|nr:hypothetical protein BV20DRAFT_1121480 [Pilatotrama ljubarskyi]